MAKLYFRYGVMGAGKSTALLQVVESYQRQSRGAKNVCILKHISDAKNPDVVSRLGISHPVDVHVNDEVDLYGLVEKMISENPELRCVVVDEVQFMAPQHIDQLFRVAVLLDIPVICYGLRTDFSTEMFPASARLFSLAHNMEKLKTICASDQCTSGKEAMFNARRELSSGQWVSSGPQLAPDTGAEYEYLALCPPCYLMNVKSLA